MRHVVALLAAALLSVAVSAAGQRQAPPAPPRFRSAVDIVHLDVSVLDGDRQPVRGLTPADFTILENGQRQKIAVFQAVDIPDAEPPSTPWVRDVAPDVRSNAGVQERRLFLIILDDATIQSAQGVNNARDITRAVIDRFGPSDLAALVFTRDNRNAQDFTADRSRLLAAADKFTIGFRDMGLYDAETQRAAPGQDDGYYMFSANVVEEAVKVLSSLPDRRKSIIYIGQGVPVDLDDLGFAQPSGLSAGASPILIQGRNSRIKTQMERAFQNARSANVNVYTLDACGLRVPFGGTCSPGLEVLYLRALAENTGGRAVVDTNDFQPGVTAIFEENASYYLLGYQPADAKQDGKIRRLEVRVNRPDVEVRTRNGYRADKAKDAAKRKAALDGAPLGAALSGILPKSDLPLQAVAVPIPLPGKRESAVAIVVGVRQPIRQGAGRTVERVDLHVAAFGVEGKRFASKTMKADVTIRAGASGLAEYDVLSRLDLKPGRYQLRIGAHVGSLSTTGSLYYDVDVPDVRSAPVALSGVLFNISPGPVVAPRDALRDVVPIVPTTRREFARGDQVIAFVRMYQGGKRPMVAVPLRVQVHDDRGAVVLDRREAVPVSQFTTARAADIRVDLPVARLAPGEYLLTLEAELPETTARQQARFSVVR
jgi:VWFA-related protein